MIALAEGARVRVLDTFTGKEAFSIDSANNPPRERRLIFSRDGAKLVIVDDKIRWCNGLTGEVIASAPRKFDYANSLALSADGLTLAYVGYADLRNRFLVLRLDAASKTVTPLAKDVGLGGTLGASALSPDGRRLATGLVLAGALALFDTTTGRPTAFVSSAHASPISAIAFSGEGAKLVSADSEGTIKVWGDAQKITLKARALQTLKGHHGAIAAVAFSTDGRRLASVGADQTARVWDLENPGVSIRRLEGYANSTMARFSPDGQWIAVAAGMEVGLWDAATGRVVRQFPSDGKNWIQSVAFSPTATRVLAVGHGGSSVESSYVALWDIDAGRELARLPARSTCPAPTRTRTPRRSARWRFRRTANTSWPASALNT